MLAIIMLHMVIKKSRVKALLFSYSSGDIFACGKCDGVVLEERFAFTIPPSRLRVTPPFTQRRLLSYATFLITRKSPFSQRGLLYGQTLFKAVPCSANAKCKV